MTTLRERLSAKRARQVVQPVQIEECGEDEAALVAEVLLAISNGASDDDLTEKRKQIDALRAERYVEVPFTAMDDEVWEKVAARHPAPEGEDGGMDWRAALPEVAALCCDDESLQDDDVWRDLLREGGGWSHGEKVVLWGALLGINTRAPAAHLPKD